MNALYKAEVTATGGRNGHVESTDGVINMDVRMPKELGGAGGAYTNPEQLFAAGYAACFDSALNLVARQLKINVKDTKVTAQVGIGQLPDGGFGLSASLSVHIPNVEQEVAQQLIEQAHKVCPYSNATRGNIEVSLQLV
ncbi:MAG: organic hydroperoxide resistance protein [Spirosomataceae bacterium]|jgi:osmotically inducible protein OsmC